MATWQNLNLKNKTDKKKPTMAGWGGAHLNPLTREAEADGSM